MIACASHTHLVFGDDSSDVFCIIKEATRGTPIALTIAAFKINRDGRGAYFAVVVQHAVIDKWESVIKTTKNFLKSSNFKGNSNYTLEKHCDGHCQNFVCLETRKLLCMFQYSSQMKDPESHTYSTA